MMHTRMRTRFTMSVVACVFLSAVDFAQAGPRSVPERLGTVSFSTSCSSAVQPQFNRAVALMHSFQFASAVEAFHGIVGTDPACSMAYWGIALSDWGNLFEEVTPFLVGEGDDMGEESWFIRVKGSFNHLVGFRGRPSDKDRFPLEPFSELRIEGDLSKAR